jgi:DNA-binding transcriptional LysR family regulator
MELRHLRYFAAVAEHLNYSEASRRLHVAQAAISQTIFDLEEELGARLLLRTKRNVQLTAAGCIFLKEAEEILRRADRAARLVRRAASGELGTLHIGFLGPATSEFLPGTVPPVPSSWRSLCL